jgi:hypothetical protein
MEDPGDRSRRDEGRRLSRRQLLARMGVGVAAVHARWLIGDRAWAAGDTVDEWACELETQQAVRTGLVDPPPSGDPALVGQWSASWLPPFRVTAVHTVVLHTGWVLLLRGPDACVWDPVGGSSLRCDPPVDVFCAGQAVLGDGTVLFAGGREGVNPKGAKHVVTFDPVTLEWTHWPDMRGGRWYPTVTTLADGRAIITSGMLEDGRTINGAVDLYDGGTVTRVLSKAFELYPKQHVLPDGRVVVTGPEPRDAAIIDPSDWSRTSIRRMNERHHNGPCVIMPNAEGLPHEIMVIGGNGTRSSSAGGPTASCEWYDSTHPSGQWRSRASLPEPRAWSNAAILPDGAVLLVGGGNAVGPTRQTLRYSSSSDTWQPMATQAEARRYHSTAVLLPDGRVLSAGDTTRGGGGPRLEVYSPPYLFRGARPTITDAPAEVAWGQQFTVSTPDTITRAVLVRPAATTHALDMNQRHVDLKFTSAPGAITATAPVGGSAPAGWYMLFLLNGDGVPSVARFVKVIPT